VKGQNRIACLVSWQPHGYCLGIVCILLILSGCRDKGPERVVVSGKVTYNGKPLPSGMIRFMPTASTNVPMAGAKIKDGQYLLDQQGAVPVGTFKVEIEALRTVAAPPGMVLPLDLRGKEGLDQQYLPKRYNSESQLEITIPPGSPPLTKNFDLTD
jgi:hypothetical protein